MTDYLDVARSLEHLAGAIRSVLNDAGNGDMRVTSEDARDIKRAAEIIRLYRMARPDNSVVHSFTYGDGSCGCVVITRDRNLPPEFCAHGKAVRSSPESRSCE